jgi:hypothetical protein
MRFLNLIAYAGSAMGMAIAAQEPSGPSISAVTHSGNGCPQDTSVESYNSGKSFKIYGFSAKAPGVDTTQNCALHFNVAGSAGWQVSVKHVSVRGYAQLPVGAGINFYFTNFWSENPDDTVSAPEFSFTFLLLSLLFSSLLVRQGLERGNYRW